MIYPSIALLSLIGVLFSGIYSFVLITRINFGPTSNYINSYFDNTRRETYILAPLFLFILFFGIFPISLTSL